jgi:hypothetical protein
LLIYGLKSKTIKHVSIEFQVFNFANKIWRLTSHLELRKKRFFYQKEVYRDFWENVNVCWLI